MGYRVGIGPSAMGAGINGHLYAREPADRAPPRSLEASTRTRARPAGSSEFSDAFTRARDASGRA